MKTKRTLSGLLALVLCLSMIIGFAPMISAAHAIFAGENCSTHDLSHGEGWAELSASSDFSGKANYYVPNGGLESAPITITGDIHLCLNGQTLSGNTANKSLITVSTGATLTICDCKGSGKIDGTAVNNCASGLIAVSGGTLKLYGGTITKYVSTGWGAVTVTSSGNFYMHGGSITQNSSKLAGAGVSINSSESVFEMRGGNITYNTNNPTHGGGGIGIISAKEVSIYDGSNISYNESTQNGGGIHNQSTSAKINIYGGTFNENTAGSSKIGGAINSSGEVKVEGGTFTNNSAAQGGAVYCANKLEISGGTFTGNSATYGIVTKAGSGDVKISGGVIKDNTTAQSLRVTAGACEISGSARIGQPGAYLYTGITGTIKNLTAGAEVYKNVDTLGTWGESDATVKVAGNCCYNTEIVSRMILGNALDMQFAIPASVMDEGAVVKIGDQTVSVDMVIDDGKEYAGYSIVTCKDIAAKEMTKEVTVTVTDKNGNIVEGRTDSVKGYAMRLLNEKTEKDEVATLLVDMLNYGAAAEVYFNKVASAEANAALTDPQKGWGTQGDITLVNNAQPEGIQSSLVLENKIDLRIAVTAAVGTEASYSFVNHRGQTVQGTATVETDGINNYVKVDKIVLSDSKVMVTVTAGENEYQDSVESYLKRNENVEGMGALGQAIMKFALSAYAYFH